MKGVRVIDSKMGYYRAYFLKFVPATQKLLHRNSVKKAFINVETNRAYAVSSALSYEQIFIRKKK